MFSVRHDVIPGRICLKLEIGQLWRIQNHASLANRIAFRIQRNGCKFVTLQEEEFAAIAGPSRPGTALGRNLLSSPR